MSIGIDFAQPETVSPDSAFVAPPLGRIIWTEFKSATVDHSDLSDLLTKHNLSLTYLPEPATPLDVWKRVTSGLRSEYSYQGITARVLVRDVDTEPSLVTRHIVREEVDASGKVLRYETIGESLFVRSGPLCGTRDGVMTFTFNSNVDATEMPVLAELADRVDEKFHDGVGRISTGAIRSMVMSMLGDLKAIGVRPSGGVYFVDESSADTVERIKALVKDVAGDSIFHSLPLVDSADQRHMLATAYQEEAQREVEALLREVAEANEKYGDGPVHGKAIRALTARLAEAQAAAEQHSKNLDLVTDTTWAALEMATKAVVEISARGRGAAPAQVAA